MKSYLNNMLNKQWRRMNSKRIILGDVYGGKYTCRECGMDAMDIFFTFNGVMYFFYIISSFINIELLKAMYVISFFVLMTYQWWLYRASLIKFCTTIIIFYIMPIPAILLFFVPIFFQIKKSNIDLIFYKIIYIAPLLILDYIIGLTLCGSIKILI